MMIDKYGVLLLLSTTTLVVAMDNETPIKRASREQARHKRAEQEVEKIRDYIDEEILGIDIKRPLRTVMGSYYSSAMIRDVTDKKRLIAELSTIQSRIPVTDDTDLMIAQLYQKHHLFKYLLDKIVDSEGMRLKRVDGTTIDEVVSNDKMISELSPEINAFIKKRVKEEYMSQNMLNRHISAIPFDKNKEIHWAPLFGHPGVNIGTDQLLMSSDSKYLRAMDDSGFVVTWDMCTAHPVTIDTSLFTWCRLDEKINHTKSQRVIDKNGIYMASHGRALAFLNEGTARIQHKVATTYSFPVITLFVRPTIASNLCQDAFIASKGDSGKLIALRESQTFKSLQGFPAANLAYLINKELQAPGSAKL